MAKGSVYETERVFMQDPRSGLTITRLRPITPAWRRTSTSR